MTDTSLVSDQFLRAGKGLAWRLYETFELAQARSEKFRDMGGLALLNDYNDLHEKALRSEVDWFRGGYLRNAKIHAAVIRHRLKTDKALMAAMEDSVADRVERDLKDVLKACAQAAKNKGGPYAPLTFDTIDRYTIGHRFLQMDVLEVLYPRKNETAAQGNRAYQAGIGYMADLWATALSPDAHVSYEGGQASAGMEYAKKFFRDHGAQQRVPLDRLDSFKQIFCVSMMAYNITAIKAVHVPDGLLKECALTHGISVGEKTFPTRSTTFIQRGGNQNYVWVQLGADDRGRAVPFSELTPSS